MKLRKHSLVDEACHILQQEIVGYEQEERLPSERVLAEKIGVSRPVLREAISRLSTFGLLEVKHGSGVYVSRHADKPISKGLSYHLPDDSKRMHDLMEFRLMVEPVSVSAIAQKVSQLDLQKLENIHLEIAEQAKKKTVSKEAFLDLDVRFHECLFELANNDILLFIMQSLRNIEQRSKHTRINTLQWKEIYEEHDLVFQAIKKGRPVSAEKAMHQHITNTINNIF